MVSAIKDEAIVVTEKGSDVTPEALNASLKDTPYRVASWDPAPEGWQPGQ